MDARLPIAIASDHAGLSLKSSLIAHLKTLGFVALDLGTNDSASVDYPDYAHRIAQAIAEGKAERGVAVCGSGIGISIAANRHSHIRAALCHDGLSARLSRLHNDANVLALGARLIGEATAFECLEQFLTTEFEGGRHANRLAKLSPNES